MNLLRGMYTRLRIELLAASSLADDSSAFVTFMSRRFDGACSLWQQKDTTQQETARIEDAIGRLKTSPPLPQQAAAPDQRQQVVAFSTLDMGTDCTALFSLLRARLGSIVSTLPITSNRR
jgi:hypothetical protein